ncbi:MAG: hypothetical protein INR62_10915 [Rhodospirillales bacterium]|nr:hypothetical protein [Acetobacter sp.]
MPKVIFVSLALLASTPAWAIDKAYLGVWTAKAGECDFSGAGPFRITARGLEEHETSCRTKRARQDSTGWSVQMSCANEGSVDKISLHWQLLSNGHLKEVSKDGNKDYVRCP